MAYEKRHSFLELHISIEAKVVPIDILMDPAFF
jgi:hypothetical protein